MADPDLLTILNSGPAAWNEWRQRNPNAVRLDLSAAMDIRGMNLAGADFSGVDLRWSALIGMDLSGCNFHRADLMGANLRDSKLVKADLTEADLQWVQFNRTDLRAAIMRHSRLAGAVFIRADASGADLSHSKVFGVSVWSLVTDAETRQTSLLITRDGQPAVTVDDIEVAQFVHLLLNREKLRNVLDTITSKAVLILGRFSAERKPVLNALAECVRARNLLPIIFDFEKSEDRDFTETIKTLAGLCLFVIADITKPSSVPLEMQATIPDYQIPFVPIIQEGEQPFSMFRDLWTKFDWVLQPVDYPSADGLRSIFEPAILSRAWELHQKLRRRKAERVKTMSWKTFLQPNE
jgi:hypothetical protein